MTSALFLHLVLGAIWLGCVLVEAVFERSGDESPSSLLFISRAHWRIDLAIETPAFLGVLATGAFMATQVELRPLLLAKIALGAAAIGFNVYCVALVRKRLRVAEIGDFKLWKTIDHAQHFYGSFVLLGLIAAMAIGGVLFCGG